MKFKAVDFSNVPAFGEVAARLGRIAPTSMPEKAGKDFDTDIYRIYVKKPSEDSIPIDLERTFSRTFATTRKATKAGTQRNSERSLTGRF